MEQISRNKENVSSSKMENSTNPINSGKEIVSFSKMQNPRDPFSFRKEICSPSMFQKPRKGYSPYTLLKAYHPGKVGKTIIDPIKFDTYLLLKEIGSSCYGLCRVYTALYSKYSKENHTLVPSGLVTLKIINKKVYVSESNELQSKIDVSEGYLSYSNLIGIKKTFTTDDLLCVSLPYMSHGSLRHILSTRPGKKLPEGFIAIVLKEALLVLRDELHDDFNPMVHKTLNSGDIFFHIDSGSGKMSIKLAFEASAYDSEDINVEENENENEEASLLSSSSFLHPNNIVRWGAAPEVYGRENAIGGPKSDIWLLGITALELAYGVLPVKSRGDLDRIIEKIKKKKTLPRSLEQLQMVKKKTLPKSFGQLLIVKKKKRKFKKVMVLFKRKGKAFSKRFVRMVLRCLSKNPKKRPSAAKLLRSSFFTKERDIKKFKRFVLNAARP